VSKIIENKFHEVTSVLSTLATAPAIHNAEIPRGYDIINLRQESTKDITDGMFWLDKDGKLLWSSKFVGNQSMYDELQGSDLSSQLYFIEPKKTETTFYSSIIDTREAPKVFITMPIIDKQVNGTESIFKGIVGTGIKTETIAEIIEADVSQAFQSQVVLLDKTGTVMYSTNQSSIGENVFSPEYRSYMYSLLPPESKGAVDTILNDLSEAKAGSQDLKFQQTAYTVSYSPITIGGNKFLVLYVLSPHNLTTEVNLLIDEQKNISSIIIAAIGGVAVGMGILIISWNRRLHSAVEERTQDLKTANEQLLNHDKMQREFIDIAAHELRTPIQPLLAITELIKSSLDGRQKTEITKQDLDMLERNARRLERLSSDILEVSRIESNSLNLNKEVVNLNEKILNVIADIRPFIKQDQQDIDIIFQPININEKPVLVEADKTRLFEVISNLLRNAIKFTKRGTIKVTLEKKEGHAIVTIKDTGTGIDPAILPRLFGKFATKSDQGTGLGLYLSKSIIEAHGGKIWAENNRDGKGATFTFTLPILNDIGEEVTKRNSESN
jgi:signal transduction histidine kinase